MIYAGTRQHLNVESGSWIITDIGFSNRKHTCGLSFDLADPVCVNFSDLKSSVTEHIRRAQSTCNLLIEAPLSVAFDRHQNPIGRSIEKEGSKTRYWYVGLGCAVMTAALYLVRAIHDAKLANDVRLFEGFVTYKSKDEDSNHDADVRLLREVVYDPKKYSNCIFDENSLKMTKDSRVVNAFEVAGLSTGVPLLIKRTAEQSHATEPAVGSVLTSTRIAPAR